MLSQNTGSYRKDIWDYMLRIYGNTSSSNDAADCCEQDSTAQNQNLSSDTLDYRDFLHAIRRLIQEGKLLHELGLFRVEPNTYQEIWDIKTEATTVKKPLN